MASPQRTIELLEQLQSLGFDDAAFAKLHHFRLSGKNDTIAKHRKYVLQQANLRENDSNEEVQRRLALVLTTYRNGGFTSRSSSVFQALADAVFHEIPPRRAGGAV